jgi:surface antigen
MAPSFFILEPSRHHLVAPGRGYRWVVVDNDAYLVEITSGLIADVVVGAVLDANGPDRRDYGPPPAAPYEAFNGPNDSGYGPPPAANDEREDRWRQRYARTYTYSDDSFYRDCHESVDPAGVIGGALIGGLLGNAVGHGGGRAGATIAGVVVGGAVGAALTRHLDCEDRSYAYKAYSDGFNTGRPGLYRWRNPDNGHYGTFKVADYYNDPDGFRCANYTQEIYVDGRPQAAKGHACQQPDGAWAIVN